MLLLLPRDKGNRPQPLLSGFGGFPKMLCIMAETWSYLARIAQYGILPQHSVEPSANGSHRSQGESQSPQESSHMLMTYAGISL